MGFDFSTFFKRHSGSPGALIYDLIVLLALGVTLVWALIKRGDQPQGSGARHLAVGAASLLVLQLILSGSRILQNLPRFQDSYFLPLTDHLLSTLIIIWLVWTVIEADPHFWLTGGGIFLSLALSLIALSFILTITFQPEALPVDQRLFSQLWMGGTLFLIGAGLVLILKLRPSNWVMGMGILFTLGLGYTFQLIQPASSVLGMPAIRLTQIISLPWLMRLSHRLPENKRALSHKKQIPQPAERSTRVDTTPTLIDQLLQISLQQETQERYQAVIKALCFSVKADVGYLILQSEAEIQVLSGYDLIREQYLEAPPLKFEDLKQILRAWDQNRFLILSESQSPGRDIETLKELLHYPQVGNVLAYPLTHPELSVAGGLIFLSPYTNKLWNTETLALLKKIEQTLSKVVFKPGSLETLQAALTDLQNDVAQLLKEKATLLTLLTNKNEALKEQTTHFKQLKAKYQIEKLETIRQIKALQAEIREYKTQATARANLGARLEQLATEIRLLTQQRDQLTVELARAKAQISHLSHEKGQTGPIRLSMENQIISLDSIVANIRLQSAIELQHKQIDLKITNPDGRQMIKTDPELIQTVLLGLLQNAIQASEEGAAIQLSQKLTYETGMLTIQVTDFGAGLTEAEQTAFFSAASKTLPGIGNLQSIRNAIRAIRVLNGKIWLKSKKETFTTFRVQLPVRIID